VPARRQHGGRGGRTVKHRKCLRGKNVCVNRSSRAVQQLTRRFCKLVVLGMVLIFGKTGPCAARTYGELFAVNCCARTLATFNQGESNA